MQSVILSNPIYQHSGESEKLAAIAQQASVNEDQEQRRRQLDKRGEHQRKLVANEIAHIVDNLAGQVQLKSTPYEEKKESLLVQAQQAASDVTKTVTDTAAATTNAVSSAASSAASTANSIFHSVASTVAAIGHTAVDTVINTATTAAAYSHDAAVWTENKAAAIGHTAVDTVINTATTAAAYSHDAAVWTENKAAAIGHTAVDTVINTATTAAAYSHDAAVWTETKASNIAHKAVDTASSVAYTAKEKTFELAETIENKAFSIADNISHFTTLVGVLAEEENERARRLVSGDESRAASNAFRVSALIRELDPCFYKQTPNLLYSTKLLEESERRWRLNSANSQLAENNAHKEGKLVANNMQSFIPRQQWVRSNINSLEEKERLRRMNDSSEAWAMINAFAASWLIKELEALYRQEGSFSKTHASYATTLLEENERRNRIRLEKLQHAGEDTAHHLMDVVNHNIEKFNYSTRQATRFASEFANLLGNATSKVAVQFSDLAGDLAKTAQTKVKSVAHDLSNFSSLMYIIALEERERARRLTDPAELTALNNAWNQAQLIRGLPQFASYNATFKARYPLGLLEETERAWRIAHIQATASRFIAGIVNASLSKFQLASKSAGEREHAKDTALHSRMNPNAPTFVPHQAFPVKVEPAPIQPTYTASSAQL